MFNPKALKQFVNENIKTREQQGYILDSVKEAVKSINEDDCPAWMKIYEDMGSVPQYPGYRYEEPDRLDSIRALRPEGPRVMEYHLTDLELKDKIHGAFLGRICGVVLGRPVESCDAGYIEEYLRGAGCWPLDHYIPRQSVIDGKIVKVFYERLRCTREYLKYAEPDDDINYVFLALKLVEKLGTNFSTLDIGYHWLDNLQANWTWGPERTAYLNLARYTEGWPRYIDIEDGKLWEISHYMNAYDERIGALIRGDLFGYVSPGLPEAAAGMAYRDAAFTHIKNGIYGEMFASAMIAASFCTDDVKRVIEIGLSEIPEGCRLSEAVRNTIQWHHECGDWREVYHKIAENYNHYGMGHTINNAAIIVNALLSGNGDLEKSLCITVMQGQDTDCTAATVGSVAGAMLGASVLPEKWTKPLNDTVLSGIFGESKNTISGTAERIFHAARMVSKTQRKVKYLYSEPE